MKRDVPESKNSYRTPRSTIDFSHKMNCRRECSGIVL